jgi:outer membrane biosynthesis protein TonB
MLTYRAAAFFARQYCPDLIIGMQTREEAYEIEEGGYSEPRPVGQPTKTEKAKKITGDILGNDAPVIDAELKAEPEPAPTPTPAPIPAPEPEPAPTPAQAPEAKETKQEEVSDPEAPPLASQSECRKIWQAYCAAFAQDKRKAKAEVNAVVGGASSGAWSKLDREALKRHLEQIEAANFTRTPTDEDEEFLAAQEEAAAFL